MQPKDGLLQSTQLQDKTQQNYVGSGDLAAVVDTPQARLRWPHSKARRGLPRGLFGAPTRILWRENTDDVGSVARTAACASNSDGARRGRRFERNRRQRVHSAVLCRVGGSSSGRELVDFAYPN